MTRRTRVLVADDSAFARKVLRQTLAADARIDVVDIARDGLDALEKIAALQPDVVTLDLVMPQLDGLGVLEAIRTMPSPPRVVVVTMSDADSALGVAALRAGAFDVVHKPTALATDRLYELGDELVHKVLLAASAPSPVPAAPSSQRSTGDAPAPESIAPTPTRTSVLVIGASTGGPRAVAQVLTRFPSDMPIPIAVVLHMPAGYTDAYARRLDGDCALEVLEAKEGMTLEAGRVVVARAGIHLRVERNAAGALAAALDVKPVEALHRPSVDTLFESAARVLKDRALAVVLTGMGEDGLHGARAIRAAGGRVLVEHASTCVVHGMPRAVAANGLANAEVPLEEMAAAILAAL